VLRELDAMEKTVSVDERSRERVALIREIDDLIMQIKSDVHTADTPDTMLRHIERYAEDHATEIDHTLRMLERSIEVIAGFSGRKVLLYVSDGLPQTPGLEVFEYYQSALDRNGIVLEKGGRADAAAVLRFDRSAAYRRVVQAAQKAGVAIYSFDASGARTEVARGAESGSTMGSFSTQSINSNLRSGLQYMAAETGGLHVGNENDVDRALARMSEQFTTYYSIGIRPAQGDIRVSVRNRKDVTVIASRRASMTTREDRLEQNLRSRLYTRDSENPLAASLTVAPPALKAAQCVAPVRLSVPQPQGLPSELTPTTVELRMVMLNERNEESAVQVATLPFDQGRVEHTMMLRIRPETLVISVAVTNPLSQETSYLQADVDGTQCR
jgi:VWFA-related protein